MSNQNVVNYGEREKGARSIIESKMAQIKKLVGNDPAKASAYASALVSLSTNSNLVDCDVDSILSAGFQIVQAGLNPNPLFNEAYVVPYQIRKDGKVSKTVATLQVGVKGYVTLAYRAGWVVKTRIVYDVDQFEADYSGFDESFEHIPNFEKRENENPDWVYKNLKGVIVMAKDQLGNIFKQFVPKAKIEQIRLKSPNQKPGAFQYIWKEWPEEMIGGKAAKYVLKRLPISENVISMMIQDEASERGNVIDVTPESTPKEKQKKLG